MPNQLTATTTGLAARVAAAAHRVDDVVALDAGGGAVATGSGDARVEGVAVSRLEPPELTVRVAARLGRPLVMIEADVRNHVFGVLDGYEDPARAAQVRVEVCLAGSRTPTGADHARRRHRATPARPAMTVDRWIPRRGTLAVLALVAGMAGLAASGLEGVWPLSTQAGGSPVPHRAVSVVEEPLPFPPPGRGVRPSDPGGAVDPQAEAELPSTHTVEPGESFGRIAARYDVPMTALLEANATDGSEPLDPGQELVLPEPRQERPASPEEAAAADLPVEDILEKVAAEHGHDPALIKAVAWQESRWNQRLVSSKGAIGLMQVQPTTGEVAAARLGRKLNLHDPVHNVKAGVAYLDALLERHGGDLHAAMAAYYQGSTSVRDEGTFAVTDRYVAEVLGLRDRFAAQP